MLLAFELGRRSGESTKLFPVLLLLLELETAVDRLSEKSRVTVRLRCDDRTVRGFVDAAAGERSRLVESCAERARADESAGDVADDLNYQLK